MYCHGNLHLLYLQDHRDAPTEKMIVIPLVYKFI